MCCLLSLEADPGLKSLCLWILEPAYAVYPQVKCCMGINLKYLLSFLGAFILKTTWKILAWRMILLNFKQSHRSQWLGEVCAEVLGALSHSYQKDRTRFPGGAKVRAWWKYIFAHLCITAVSKTNVFHFILNHLLVSFQCASKAISSSDSPFWRKRKLCFMGPFHSL